MRHHHHHHTKRFGSTKTDTIRSSYGRSRDIEARLTRSVKFFSKLNYYIFGYFDPVDIYFLIIKINNSWGDLSGISTAGDNGNTGPDAAISRVEYSPRLLCGRVRCIEVRCIEVKLYWLAVLPF